MKIIVESFYFYGGGSSSKVRARVLPGQGLPTDAYVECSKEMRGAHPVGSKFKIYGRLTDRQGTPFIYSNYLDPYEVVTDEEAQAFIKENHPE